jgi:hypothetical protein
MTLIIINSDKQHIIKKTYPKILVIIYQISSMAFFLAFVLRMGKIIQSINLTNDLINSNRKKASIFYSKRF